MKKVCRKKFTFKMAAVFAGLKTNYMKQIFVVLFFIFIPLCAGAQNTKGKASDLPPWAAAHHYDATAHVYFPDYYTFYDPKRKGYVYWENGKYTFTPAVPPFLEKVDMRKTRIQILKGLSLELHPEQDYPYYMKMYPADHENNLVPVPVPGNPAGIRMGMGKLIRRR